MDIPLFVLMLAAMERTLAMESSISSGWRKQVLRWVLRNGNYLWIFFKTFSVCSLPSTVSENRIKKIGYHPRKRDMMGQSCPIYACTHANHARYSSVPVSFYGSWKHSLSKWYLAENLKGWKPGAYGRTSYKICGKKSDPLKRGGRKAFVESLFSWSKFAS